MKMVNKTLGLTLLSCFLFSCGDDLSRLKVRTVNLNSQTISSQLTFQLLNSSVVGNLSGAGSIRFDEGKVLISVESDGHAPNSKHIQIVYDKKSCPLDADDKNGDGLIDYQEALGESAPVLSLTSDLSDTADFPTADETGKYLYQVSQDSTLNKSVLEGKIILIHGVDQAVSLPDTVQGGGQLTAHESLPVACALINFVEEQDQEPETTIDLPSSSETSGKGGYIGKGGGLAKGDQHQQQQQQLNREENISGE